MRRVKRGHGTEFKSSRFIGDDIDTMDCGAN